MGGRWLGAGTRGRAIERGMVTAREVGRRALGITRCGERRRIEAKAGWVRDPFESSPRGVESPRPAQIFPRSPVVGSWDEQPSASTGFATAAGRWVRREGVEPSFPGGAFAVSRDPRNGHPLTIAGLASERVQSRAGGCEKAPAQPGRAGGQCRGYRPYAPVGRYPRSRPSRIQTDGSCLRAFFADQSMTSRVREER